MILLINYASRTRPQKFFEGLHNIIDMAADKQRLIIRAVLDSDDPTVDDNFRAQAADLKFERVIFDYGYSKDKIHAINRPLPEVSWDALINFSDDMRFTAHGYDDIIREGFRCNGRDKFLHYPDSTAKAALATMSVMDRSYYERDGYIYHPSYQSLFCDNEAMTVAQMRGCYVYMGIMIFDHLHPAYGLAPFDPQYIQQQGLWHDDEQNYIYRKSKNFDLQENENVNQYRV